MRTGFLALVMCIVVALAGCGGGGEKNTGASTTSMIPEEYLSSLQAAINTRDIDFIRSQISNDYSENCETKEQLVARIMDVLSSGGPISFTTLPISNKSVEESRNKAEFTGGFRIDVAEGDAIRTFEKSGRIYLRRDNTPWQLYGDHNCMP
jgi:hypothetical protein